jgi:tetratricopeptide (TPR) repeat protein
MTNDDNAQAIFDKGKAAYEKGDLKQAKKLFKSAADVGHSGGMVGLGAIAHDAEDLVEAKQWYQLAADVGNSYAMFNLGILAKTQVFILGESDYEPEDLNGAINWFTRAAKAGNAQAMFNLGEISETNGNIEEQKYWYQLAADSDNIDAKEKLQSVSLPTKQYYAEFSDDLSNEILEILHERFSPENNYPKKLSQMDRSYFAEVIDHIYEDENYAEKLDGLMEIFFACAVRMKDPLESLKLLQYSLERYSRVLDHDWANTGSLDSGIHLIWSIIFEANSLNKSEKTKIFKSIIDDEDSWQYPASALIMCLLWDLGPGNMDYCILKYFNHRNTDLVLDDPWSQDSGLDFHQWLYLLVVAALNSTASKEVMQVIEKTCSSSSVNAFWMIIGYLARFGVDSDLSESNIGEFGLPGLGNSGDDWGSLLFDSHFRKVKANGKAVSALINLYKSNSKNWPWDFDFYGQGDKDDLDRFIDLWSSKLLMSTVPKLPKS